MDKLVKSVKSWRTPRPVEKLTRSQHSLVSTDLTEGAVQLWLGLPDELKYDPALEQFRQHYEKQHGGLGLSRKSKSGSSTKRLPSVNSAPHLNNNLQIPRDDISVAFLNGSKQIPSHDEKKEKMLEDEPVPKKPTKMAQAIHVVKMILLVAMWMFFTVVFLMYSEKEQVSRHSSVAPGEVKSYPLQTDKEQLSVLLQITGPFVSEQNEKKLKSSDKLTLARMEVWLEEDRFVSSVNERNQMSRWFLYLDPEDEIDFTEGETRSKVLKLAPTRQNYLSPGSNHTGYVMMSTTSTTTTPFTLSYTMDPLDLSTGLIYACILLCALYILIIFEVINRTIAAVMISTASLAVLALAGERPSLPELISWLDVETLLLLFSMMLIVAIMAETGLFDFLAVFTFEVTKGKIWPLITLLSAITAVLSTFLDNVTTVLLMSPVTIRLCEVMELDPIPVLMSMVLFSNIGGTATPVGDPPNVIIASNKAVIQSGINFTNFTLHMTLGILLVCVQTYFQFRYIYRDTDKLRLHVPRDIIQDLDNGVDAQAGPSTDPPASQDEDPAQDAASQRASQPAATSDVREDGAQSGESVIDLRHRISIWRRAADSLPHLSSDEQVVRDRLERKVKNLSAQLEALVKETNYFETMLADLKDKYKIRDKVLLIKCTVAITFVVVVFFLHSIPEFNRVSLGWTALLGALLLLTLADREDLEPVLHRIEWSTLLFFAALFVLMEALSKLGLIEYIGGLTEGVISKVDESARLAAAILLMLWVSGVTSAFVDNIPLTTMMVRVVTSLGNNPTLELPMAPLIWALSFGACLGGNGTLIGASANVVCAGVAEQHGYKFTFVQFFKIGFPIMIGNLIVASGYLMLCHCLFEWH